MECDTTLAPILTTLTALFTAGCAVASFWLAKRIYREAKTDERLIFGPLAHPSGMVSNPAHHNAVIGCAVFNKSHRKAFIENFVAFSESRNRVEITWSDSIDHLGNPGEPRALIGVVDSNTLYMRRNDGEWIDYVRLEVTHSFPDSHIHRNIRSNKQLEVGARMPFCF